MKNVVLTGGHAASTAYAVIQEIRRKRKGWRLFFLGPRSYIEGFKAPTIESKVFPKLGVEFIPIFTGRVQRKFTLWTIPSILKIPVGFLHAFIVLKRIKPSVILSFGGFSAFPVVVMGFLLRIPIIVHEQTSVVGRANKYSAFFAQKIAISRESSKVFFKGKNVVLTGNPVSDAVRRVKIKQKIGSPPTLLITGGKSGSVSINSSVQKILDRLLSDFKVIHQVGSFQYKNFLDIRRNLAPNLRRRYYVYEFISPLVWYKFLAGADMLVSRAGANIVSEIICTKRPAVLIPLPFSYLDEQMHNALYAKKFGLVEILEQERLSPDNLYSAIIRIRDNWKKMVNSSKSLKSPDLDASEKLVDLLSGYV